MQQPERVNGIVVAQLRAAKPHASEELRERVRIVAGGVPPLPERRRRDRWMRRLFLVVAPAAVAATVIGLVSLAPRDTGDGEMAAGVEAAVTTESAGGEAAARSGRELAPVPRTRPRGPAFDVYGGASETGTARSAAERLGETDAGVAQTALGGISANDAARSLPPSGRRLQEYRAALRVRVRSLDDLTTATTQAMRITRRMGGYVVRAGYTQPGGGDGDSTLVVRVPVTQVSAAVLAFANLGVIAAQDVSIVDLQTTYNRQTDEIEALRRTIASLRRELQTPDLTDEARDRLRARLVNAETTLTQRLRGREATERRGRLATVSLTLTTRDEGEIQPPTPPGRFEDTLRDALHVLATVATWALAALIVVGPFLALAAVAVVLDRRRRRRADDRLLQRTAEA